MFDILDVSSLNSSPVLVGHAIRFPQPNTVRIDMQPFEFHQESILVQSICTLISKGTELAQLDGTFKWYDWNRIPGYSNISVVLHSNDSEFKPGTLLYSQLPHISKCRIEDNTFYRLPLGIDPADAVFTTLLSIGNYAAEKAAITTASKVLVVGDGLISLFTAKFCQHYLPQCLDVVGKHTERQKLFNRFSKCDFTINETILPEKWYDVVINCCGTLESLTVAKRYASDMSHLVQVGTIKNPLFRSRVLRTSRGITLQHVHQPDDIIDNQQKRRYSILRLLEQNKLRMGLLREFVPLANAFDAVTVYKSLQEQSMLSAILLWV